MMKKSTTTILSLLLFVLLSSFSPAKHGLLNPVVSKSLSARFFGMSGPNIISASGGPYLIKATGLPVSENGNSLFCGDKIQGEQYLVFPDAGGSADIEVYGSSFSNLRGSQRIWIEDQYGNTLESIYVFVTN